MRHEMLVEAMDSLNDREKHILTERRLTDNPQTLEELSPGLRRQPRTHPPDRGARVREAAEGDAADRRRTADAAGGLTASAIRRHEQGRRASAAPYLLRAVSTFSRGREAMSAPRGPGSGSGANLGAMSLGSAPGRHRRTGPGRPHWFAPALDRTRAANYVARTMRFVTLLIAKIILAFLVLSVRWWSCSNSCRCRSRRRC